MNLYQKQAYRQFGRDFFKDWALITLRNAVDAGSRAEKDAMDQLLRILKAPLG